MAAGNGARNQSGCRNTKTPIVTISRYSIYINFCTQNKFIANNVELDGETSTGIPHPALEQSALNVLGMHLPFYLYVWT